MTAQRIDVNDASWWPKVRSFSAKKSSKGEDFVLVREFSDYHAEGGEKKKKKKRTTRARAGVEDEGDGVAITEWGNGASPVRFAVYGIFDGHGGADAAAFCASKDDWFVAALKDAVTKRANESTSRDKDASVSASSAVKWSTHLPGALRDVFHLANEECCSRFKRAGTTATVVVISQYAQFRFPGEQMPESRYALLTCANVGDSHAYLDHGGKVHRLNEDHRLDSNGEERRRVEAAGAVVKQDVGEPRRMWPGGLMMSRTIGDCDATSAICDPAVTNAWVPLKAGSGARVLIASDGLWDYMKGAEACAMIRRKKPQAGAQLLVQSALKKCGRGPRDDISLIIVDVVSCEKEKLPFSLNMSRSVSSMHVASSSVARSQTLMKTYTSGMEHEWKLRMWKPLAKKSKSRSRPADVPLEMQPETFDPGAILRQMPQEEQVEIKNVEVALEKSPPKNGLKGTSAEEMLAEAIRQSLDESAEWQEVAPRRRRTSSSESLTQKHENVISPASPLSKSKTKKKKKRKKKKKKKARNANEPGEILTQMPQEEQVAEEEISSQGFNGISAEEMLAEAIRQSLEENAEWQEVAPRKSQPSSSRSSAQKHKSEVSAASPAPKAKKKKKRKTKKKAESANGASSSVAKREKLAADDGFGAIMKLAHTVLSESGNASSSQKTTLKKKSKAAKGKRGKVSSSENAKLIPEERGQGSKPGERAKRRGPGETYACKICGARGQHWFQRCPAKTSSKSNVPKPTPSSNARIGSKPAMDGNGKHSRASLNRKTSVPGDTYVCKVCGEAGKHWFQQCPMRRRGNAIR